MIETTMETLARRLDRVRRENRGKQVEELLDGE